MRFRNTLRRSGSVLVAGLALAMVATGCSSDEPAAPGAKEDFNILFIGGVTGSAAATVKATTDSLQAAADSVNEGGGIDGRKIVLTIKDSKADPTTAVTLLQESLSANDLPDLVVPSGTSAEALAMVPLLTRSKIVSVAFAANPGLNDPEKYPYHFQTTPNSTAQLTGLKQHLQKANVKKLGVLVSQDAYGQGVTTAIKTQLEGSGIDIQVSEFVPTDVDLSVSYRRMLDGNPDFVYLDTTGDAAVRLLQARVQTNSTDIPTIAGSGMSLTAGGPYKYGSAEANKNLEILVFKVEVAVAADEQSAVFKDFFARYSKGQTVSNSLSTPSLGWDQIRLAAAAASQPGALDNLPDSLVNSFYSLKVADGYWLTEKEFAYSATKHTPTPTADDFPFIPSSPQVNGQYQLTS